MGCEVIANTCVHCGSLHGNWHVMEDLLEMPYNKNMNDLIDIVLSNNLTFEDLYDPEDFREESFSLKLSTGHIHHKDGNPENNNPTNLILLCRDCHAKIQSQLRNDMDKRKS
jgi:5-methylcytosine-specific restriction endonuclease McrA